MDCTDPRFPHPLHDELRNVQKRLRELEQGAEPESTAVGICNDLCHKADFGYDKTEWLFHQMGFKDNYPLGKYEMCPWEGEAGERRRKLCGEMADFIDLLLG